MKLRGAAGVGLLGCAVSDACRVGGGVTKEREKREKVAMKKRVTTQLGSYTLVSYTFKSEKEGNKRGKQKRETKEGNKRGKQKRETKEGNKRGKQKRETKEGNKRGKQKRETKEGNKRGKQKRETKEGKIRYAGPVLSIVTF